MRWTVRERFQRVRRRRAARPKPTLDLMMTGTAQFPQRGLLLGVLWFPATFLVLWACEALGMWSSHRMDTSLAVFFAAVFVLAFTLQMKVVVPALALLRLHVNMRLPLNYLLLGIGLLTAVIAAGFVLLFGLIAFNNQQGTVMSHNCTLERLVTALGERAGQAASGRLNADVR